MWHWQLQVGPHLRFDLGVLVPMLVVCVRGTWHEVLHTVAGGPELRESESEAVTSSMIR